MAQYLTDGDDSGPLITENTVYALGGNDVVISAEASPSLFGGDGNDFLGTSVNSPYGSTNAYGGDGNDSMHGGTLRDHLFGGKGVDLLVGGEFSYPDADNGVIVALAGEGSDNDLIYGAGGADGLYGFDGDDVLSSGNGSDQGVIHPKSYSGLSSDRYTIAAGVYGGDGNDRLIGGDGSDRLDGGDGRDLLFGGDGGDIFAFNAATDSPKGARDTIEDFGGKDRIDLTGIDADAIAPDNQAFAFIGGDAFHGVAGELRFAHGKLQGDIDGNGIADLLIKLAGVSQLGTGVLDL